MTTEATADSAVVQPTLAIDFATKAESDAGHRHVLGEKCDACMAAEPWRPYAGARSFAEYDRFVAADRVEDAVNDEMRVFDMLLMNVRSSDDLDPIGKANAMAALSTQLADRLDARRREAEAENAGERGLSGDAATDDPGMVNVFKDTSGQYRWLAIHTNKFVDREGEIFSEGAHKAFVDWVNETGSFPALRIWHLPMDIGRADFVSYDDAGFVVSSGTFNKGYEDVAEKLMAEKGLGCSHGFLYRKSDLVDGVYKAYRSYEVSVLPNERAANTLTAFFAGEEFPMLNPAAKAFLEKVAGPDRTKAVEENVQSLSALAGERGLSYKDLEETLVEVSAKDGATAMPETATAAPPVTAAPTAPPVTAAQTAPPVTAPTEPAAQPSAPAADPVPVAPAADPQPEQAAAQEAAPTPTPEEQAEAAAAAQAAEPIIEQKAAEDFATGLREAFVSSMEAGLAPVLAGMKALQDTVEAQGAEIAALKAGRDAEVAEAIRPRVGPTAALPASMSDGNLVTTPPPQSGAKDAAPAPIDPYVGDLMHLFGRQPQPVE